MAVAAPASSPIVLERVLAQRGESVVYLATLPQGQRVTLRSTPLQDPAGSAERTARMREVLAALSGQPAIITCKRYFEAAGRGWLVREFEDAVTLQDLLDARDGALSVAAVVSWMKQVAELVAWFHEQRPTLALGELRAGHFVLDEYERLRLIDLAALHSEQPITPDVPNEIRATGALFYLLLTRQAPARPDPVPPQEINAAVPALLNDIVMKMLASDPAHGYASMRGVSEALRGVNRVVRRDGSSQGSLVRRCPACRLRVARASTTCSYCANPAPPASLPFAGMGEEAVPSHHRAPSSTLMVLVTLAVLVVLTLLAVWLIGSTPGPDPGPARPPRKPAPRPSVKGGAGVTPARGEAVALRRAIVRLSS